MIKIKRAFSVSPDGDKYPHMVKETHKTPFPEKDLNKAIREYEKGYPKGWTIEVEYDYCN